MTVPDSPQTAGEQHRTTAPFVVVDKVVKHYSVRGPGWRKLRVRALDGVSLSFNEGEVVGLVGESGCGKTTFAKVLLRLVQADSGTIRVAGTDLTNLHGAQLRRFRCTIQLVFQNPYAALDPRLRIGTSLEQPLAQHGIGTPATRRQSVLDMLCEVGLDGAFLNRLPSHCSGGELQRVVIARALLLKPRFLVCDEPTSALDAALRAQIINLLVDLKRRLKLTLLIISHDLRVVRYISDRVAVMYLGKIVEIGPRHEVFNRPQHPYTRALIAASVLEENGLGATDAAQGEPPSPINPPSGCAFHPRCVVARARCQHEQPPLEVVGDGHRSACFYSPAVDSLSEVFIP